MKHPDILIFNIINFFCKINFFTMNQENIIRQQQFFLRIHQTLQHIKRFIIQEYSYGILNNHIYMIK